MRNPADGCCHLRCRRRRRSFFFGTFALYLTAAVRQGHFLRAGMAGSFRGHLPAFLYGNLAYFLSRSVA